MASREALLKAAGEVDHWKFFSEFCHYEMLAGGPDPHMKVTIRMSEDDGCDWSETAWRGLCYLGVYNVPCAAAIWGEYPWERARKAKGFTKWLEKNWKGIVLRRERKCVRSAARLGEYLSSAAAWLRRREGERGWAEEDGPRAAYAAGWEDVQTIKYMGRYVAIKFLEYSRRCLGTRAVAHDIRPKGGWSPREALVLLYPEDADRLLGDDSEGNCQKANALAQNARLELLEYDIDLDWYNLQVLLCDYKQCYVGRRQFPGRSQDSEMEYDRKIRDYWAWKGGCTPMYSAREAIFPKWALGEKNGWDSVRKELGDCLAVYGYTWSDSLYDYHASSRNLACPVRRKKLVT